MVKEERGPPSGIVVLSQMETGEGVLEKHDSGVGESVASSPCMEEVASSQEGIQLTPLAEQSSILESTTVKKRLAFDVLEDGIDGRPAKRALYVDRLEGGETPLEEEDDGSINDLSNSVPMNTQFMTSEDFITSRQGVRAPSSSRGVLVDLTSTEETQSPLRHHHYPLFTSRHSGAGAQVHMPSTSSSGRRKGPRGALRVGNPCLLCILFSSA